MLPKQRVVAALTFSRPDRIPMGETGVDYPITEQALGRPTLYRGKWKEYQAIWQGRRDEYVASCKRDIVALAHKFEHDFVPVFLVPSRHKPTPEPEFLSAYRWRLPDGRVYRFSPETEGHAFLESAPPVSLDHLLEVPSEIDDSELELVEHVVRELGDTHFIVGRLPSGVFPIDRYLFENMLTGMIDHPDMIRRILELETAYNLVAGERLLAAGCDAIMDLSDVAGNNGPFMSPRMFEEFICPHLKSQAELAHSRGRFFLKHTDGNMWRLLDLMIEAGVDAWHGIQPKIGMELPKLQARFGGRICFFGGVEVDTLIRGTEKEVAEEVSIAIESAPEEGGLVLASGNTLMVGVEYRNYMSMLRTAKSYWS